MNRILFLFAFLPISVLFSQESVNHLNAFGDTPWGTSFQKVREKFESLARNPNTTENVQILNEVRNKLLVIKRNNVNYIYRFYKKPREVKELTSTEAMKADHNSASGLFSVGVVFSPVESKRVKESLSKYGNPTKEYLVENTFGIIQEKTVTVTTKQSKDPTAEKDVNDKKEEYEPEEVDEDEASQEEARKIPAAYIWSLSSESQGKKDGGYVIQWTEPYQKRLYTKRIDFFSSELSSQITADYKTYFSYRESKIILDLLTTPPKLPEDVPAKVETNSNPPGKR
jgi:hypothetical protein